MIRWAILQPQQRAILPWRRCAITGHRIGIGELYNEALQVRVVAGNWRIQGAQESNQYISQQGQAILVLQGSELIEEVVSYGGKKVI